MAKKYYEKIVIANGGVIARCQECKKFSGLRFVTETRNIAPTGDAGWQDTHTYNLCDRCADREKNLYAQAGAEVIDGRQPVVEQAGAVPPTMMDF